MNSEGNKLVVDNHIPDPADSIARALLSALASSHAVDPAAAPLQVAADDPAQISAAADGSRFVIDVRTMDWGFSYLGFDWTRYRVYYKAKARLIDATSKSVVAEGFCNKTALDESSATATYDELLADQATRLKANLSAVADDCAKALRSEMLLL